MALSDADAGLAAFLSSGHSDFSFLPPRYPFLCCRVIVLRGRRFR